MFLDRLIVGVGLREHGARSGLGGTLPLLSIASGLFGRRALADPPGRSLRKTDRSLQVGRRRRPLLEAIAFARATSAAFRSSAFRNLLGSLPLTRRVLSLSRLARKLDGPLIDPLLSHTAQGFEKDSAASPTHPNPRAPGTQSYWEDPRNPRGFSGVHSGANTCEIPALQEPLPSGLATFFSELR